MSIAFTKMHGLGNDFVIIDERNVPMQIIDNVQRTDEVRDIANRKTGVGCDQLIVLRPSGRADVYMQIYNADGSEVSACGNATRCVGWFLMREKRSAEALIDTKAGLLECTLAGEKLISVNMGIPHLDWNNIPLAKEMLTTNLPIELEMLKNPVAVNVGNPHAVFFVDNVGAIPLKELGPQLEVHPLFPEKTNVEIAQVDSSNHITLRVWERGAGETQACGTGACATVIAARRLGLIDAKTTVQLLGGELEIIWEGSAGDTKHPVWMTGAVAESFTGTLPENRWV